MKHARGLQIQQNSMNERVKLTIVKFTVLYLHFVAAHPRRHKEAPANDRIVEKRNVRDMEKKC